MGLKCLATFCKPIQDLPIDFIPLPLLFLLLVIQTLNLLLNKIEAFQH